MLGSQLRPATLPVRVPTFFLSIDFSSKVVHVGSECVLDADVASLHCIWEVRIRRRSRDRRPRNFWDVGDFWEVSFFCMPAILGDSSHHQDYSIFCRESL